MRRAFFLVATLVLAGCPAEDVERPAAPPRMATIYLSELEFQDRELKAIVQRLVPQARARGLDTIDAPNCIEALLLLESSLGASPRALERFNSIVQHASSADASPWAVIRQRARRRFAGEDSISQRVQALVDEWDRHKLDVVAHDLCQSATSSFFHDMRWETEFHQFVRQRPLHAGTWGWLLLHEKGDDVQRQYGRRDAVHAYRYYLETTRLGTEREARGMFAIPGVAIR